MQPHETALRNWLRARFPLITDRDDLIQESYLRVIRAQASGPIACAKAFLFATARNLAHNTLRRRRHDRPEGLVEFDPSSVLDSGPPAPELLARAEEIKLLEEAIQSLPPRCRQVFTLRRFYGLSQKEVASRLGITERTVEEQSAIAVRKCAEFVRRRHDFWRRSE